MADIQRSFREVAALAREDLYGDGSIHASHEGRHPESRRGKYACTDRNRFSADSDGNSATANPDTTPTSKIGYSYCGNDGPFIETG